MTLRLGLRVAALALLALGAMCAALLVGATSIPAASIATALTHPQATDAVSVIVWQLRLPRICDVAFVGAALAIAGTLLQGLLRNPLVDPYLTGVSAGAAAAIAISLLLGVSAVAAPGIGFVAGLGTAVLVAALARRGSGLDAQRLILAGVSLSAFFSAIVALAIVSSQSGSYANAIIGWLAGSPAGRTWHDVWLCLPYAAFACALVVPAVPALNALRIGDVQARSVGVNVERAQWLVLAAAALLAACSVELAGLIGFVGLIVPHAGRKIVGTDVRFLLPASAFAGALLCVLADAVCRTIVAPAELPLGVLLAFIGVPVFLWLFLRTGSER
jgi:iron complex transport system permease protein